jgi:hypothetical protein
MSQLIGSGLLAFTKILGMDPKAADKLCRDGIAATVNEKQECALLLPSVCGQISS